ncbi:MAG TPA: transposase family protein [Ktedonosporobacter sp.]|nr:transposase family protein [Ktedonosporobacter sp.]
MLCVSLLSTQSASCCPVCGSPATCIHSRYQRRLADLPSGGQPVRFLLSVRNFFCFPIAFWINCLVPIRFLRQKTAPP